MANSADPDQLASKKPTDLNLHSLQRQGISGFSRTRVNIQAIMIISGRGKRKVDSKYLKRSATPSPRKPAKKPVKEHFSRLKGIIDSEGSDED